MSDKDSWETPQDLYDELDEEFNFLVDACAQFENSKCKYRLKDATECWSYGSLIGSLPGDLWLEVTFKFQSKRNDFKKIFNLHEPRLTLIKGHSYIELGSSVNT